MPRYAPPRTVAEALVEDLALAKKRHPNMPPGDALEQVKLEEGNQVAVRAERIRLRDVNPYGPGSEHRAWLDYAKAGAGIADPDAKERLARFESATKTETRALTSSTFGGIVPILPLSAAEAFEAAVRSSAPLYAALDKIPLEARGMTARFQKVTAGSTGQVQNPENTIVTITDATAAFDDEPVATFVGILEYSMQLHDRGMATDEKFAADLGAALAAKIESELWVGTGSSGRIKGLTQASPGTSVAAGGQTTANNLGALFNAHQQLTVAFGRQPEILACHPRRSDWLRQAVAGAPVQFVPPGCELVESPAAPATLGGGSEDWPFFIVRSAAPIATEAPKLSFQVQQSGTSMEVRSILTQYLAFGSSARPEGLAKVTALTTPTFG